MSNRRARKRATIWFYGAVAVAALLVAMTALDVLGRVPGPGASLLDRFSLIREKNLAAWWSGMLLAVVSLHASDGHTLLRRRDPGAASGWALIATVLLFFSADEVGSIHERLSLVGAALGFGTWSLLLPLGAVLGAVLGGALVLLWLAGGNERRAAWLLAVGFLLLGSVALQEVLEHAIEWQTDAARAVRAAVEEGTELTGTLVLLGAAMANTAGLAPRGAAADGPAFAALHDLRRPLATLGLVLAPVFALVTVVLVDQRGQPADWLAALAFLAAGLAACRHLLLNGGGIGWPTWAIGGLCCLASVAAVAVGPVALVALGPVEISLRMLIIGLIALFVCALWLCVPGGGRRGYPLGVVVLGLLVVAALLPANRIMTHLLPQLLGLAVYWVNTMRLQEQIGGRLSLPDP